jgi:retron-type reverse transcriptase
MHTASLLYTVDDLDNAFQWVVNLRKEYSPNSDIWYLRRDWTKVKHQLLAALNDGSYQFSPLNRYEFSDATISLWSSQDMIVLKLISQALQQQMGEHIPKSCYHVKGHGGLKKAVRHTYAALPDYRHVMRSDIKGYYETIRFDILTEIIESYVDHPILLILLRNALRRTETNGGIFHDYYEHGIPKGSPLSPLLGAIALIPLDKAMSKIKGIFYARFMDDWVVLTKSKTALRKVVKITHKVVNALKLQLHPAKNFIGKISHGFNFLAYYMDDKKILPSQETFRRFSERAVLYEPSQSKNISRRYKKNQPDRDISEYQCDEPAPTDEDFTKILTQLWAQARNSDTVAALRQYLGKWALWLKYGLKEIQEFVSCVRATLPSVSAQWEHMRMTHQTQS